MERSSTPAATDTRLIPWIVATALFMQTLDGSILNTALPAMAQSLHESPLRMQSTIIAYMLTMAMLIPASGWLSDRFGSRRVFVTAITLFALGSLFCALSPTLGWLVASRIVQGVGGAMMMPIGRLVVLRVFPRSELVRVLSFVTIPGLLGPLLGPTLGGWLVQYASWHWIFLINIPVGIAGGLASWRFLPDLYGSGDSGFDWPGFALFSVATVLISLAFEGMGELHLSPPRVLLLLAAGLAGLTAYYLHSRTRAAALFSPRLFAIHSFAVGIAGNLFARLGIGAMPFLTPLLLQVALGFSPAEAGMSMIPMALASIVIKPIATRLIARFGFRRILVANTLLLGAMIAGFALIPNDPSRPLLYAYLALFGGINSLQFTAMNALTLIDLDDEMAAGGNSLLSVVMQLSISLGVASAAAVLNAFVDLQDLPAPAVILSAFHKTYLCVGLMTAFATSIFFQLPRSEDGEYGTKKRRYSNQQISSRNSEI
ncbi:MAG: multidrug transporter subunit MdtD [Candidatus Accumulibacter sp.]|jgi:EmrB/QacA subfamily drug resistance transporter|nr:multidrug transporter subunit MdtD [Accumulibacter sp.]